MSKFTKSGIYENYTDDIDDINDINDINDMFDICPEKSRDLVTYKLNIPWSEYHRPSNIENIISHPKIKKTMKKYIENGYFPHLMFYGPPGTGKTSIIRAFSTEFYGLYSNLMVMEINASENRGIDVVREDITNFVSSTSNFIGSDIHKFKLIILDEADHLTTDAQGILRNTIEKYTKSARFCIICNDKSKIIPAIESRTTIMKFSPINDDDIRSTINKIAKFRKLIINDECINMLIKITKGDLRFLINKLQALSMETIINNPKDIIEITTEMVSISCGYPTNNDINKIIEIITDNDKKLVNFNEKLNTFKKYIKDKNISLTSIMDELSYYLYDNIIANKKVNSMHKKIFNVMANIESLMCNVSNNEIYYRLLLSANL